MQDYDEQNARLNRTQEKIVASKFGAFTKTIVNYPLRNIYFFNNKKPLSGYGMACLLPSLRVQQQRVAHLVRGGEGGRCQTPHREDGGQQQRGPHAGREVLPQQAKQFRHALLQPQPTPPAKACACRLHAKLAPASSARMNVCYGGAQRNAATLTCGCQAWAMDPS